LDPLERIAVVADSLGSGDIGREALELLERSADGRFYVACVGEFKRGKSSLLNALVGQPVLPVGLMPVTSVPIILRHGAVTGARVRLRDRGWRDILVDDLRQFVTEDLNPQNAKGVDGAEVFVSSPLLAGGMCLVDTPGIGSVFEANTSSTRAFLRHVDAAIAVLGVDPPLSGDELSLIDRVAAQSPHVLYVLNKVDRHTEAERSEAEAFTQRILAARMATLQPREATTPEVLQVSATAALAGGPALFEWNELVRRLQDLEAGSGRVLVAEALRLGTARLCNALRGELAEHRSALQRPLDESERRVNDLRRIVEDSAKRALELRHLFNAEEEELARSVERERAQFRRDIDAEAWKRVRVAIDRAILAGASGRDLRRRAMEAARDVTHSLVSPWLGRQQTLAEAQYRSVGERFATLATGFIASLARAGRDAVDGSALVSPTIGSGSSFGVPSGFRYTDLMDVAEPASIGGWFFDLLAPAPVHRRAVIRDAERYLNRLLDSNSAGVAEDLRERVRESRRVLEAEVQRALRSVHASAVRAELDRLELLDDEMRAMEVAPRA
jgi:predicted GTPase